MTRALFPLAGLLVALLWVWAFAEAVAQRRYAEVVYSQAWCKAQGGEHQARIVHRVTGETLGYADCLTEREAVEVEFEHKWYEGVGQVLWYSMNTGLRARLVLVGEAYGKYHLRVLNVVWQYRLPIEVEVIEP